MMRRRTAILLATTTVAALVVPVAAGAKSKPKMQQCGAFSGAQGTVAGQLVQSVSVSKGTKCSKGQSIAAGYTGQAGKFKVSGWPCSFSLMPPPGTSSVGCTNRGARITFGLAVANDCSGAPGVKQQGGKLVGPFVYNVDCGTAVPVFNKIAGDEGVTTVPGWTCWNTSDDFNAQTFSCVMKSGSSYQVIQGGTEPMP
jgi:hypothetical protein